MPEFQVVSDFTDPREEVATVVGMAEASGRPLSISLSQVPTKPEGWRSLLAAIAAANERGLTVSAQVGLRSRTTATSRSATRTASSTMRPARSPEPPGRCWWHLASGSCD